MDVMKLWCNMTLKLPGNAFRRVIGSDQVKRGFGGRRASRGELARISHSKLKKAVASWHNSFV
jgi:hypothetical protein